MGTILTLQESYLFSTMSLLRSWSKTYIFNRFLIERKSLKIDSRKWILTDNN